LDTIEYTVSPYDAAKDADLLAIMTEWNEFRNLNFSQIRDAMKGLAVLDARNVYNPSSLKALGFRYDSVGRP
jgi:UDPglucose 6-dehydrogenase